MRASRHAIPGPNLRGLASSPQDAHRQPAILRTKRYRPQLPADVVRRGRLLELMAGAAHTPVTLVSGPAGYGKSVLVSHWVEESDYDSVWLSLGESESDLRLFLTYLLAGIESARPGACAETGSVVVAAELPSVQIVARSLANDLATLDSPIVVALDDYHHIAASSAVHELLELALAHPPQTVRLILISRSDPPLGLVKLRADGQLTEVQYTGANSWRRSPQSAEAWTTWSAKPRQRP